MTFLSRFQIRCDANPLVDYLNNDREISYQDDFICPTLWQRLVIGAGGEVLLCINDEFGRHIIGNAGEESVVSIWRGEKMEKARSIHREHKGVDKIKYVANVLCLGKPSFLLFKLRICHSGGRKLCWADPAGWAVKQDDRRNPATGACPLVGVL